MGVTCRIAETKPCCVKMQDPKTVLLLLACTTFFWTVALTDKSSSSGTCYKSDLSEYVTKFVEAFKFKLGDNVTETKVYINCISFDEHQELKSAIVSGGNYTDNMVLQFYCNGGTLFAFNSPRSFNTTESGSCVDCDTDSSTGSACIEPCDETCERCYHNSTTCECSGVLDYDVEKVSDELDNLAEEDEEIESAIEEVIKKNSMCKTECTKHGFYANSSHGNPHICYACGIQFCIECHEEEGGHGKGSRGECTECLPNTHLYHHGEGECLYGFLAEVLEVVEEQEHEVEEEEREKNKSRTDLAISLPIVSVGVIAFFIIMSFIAHKRYPHIGETGQKRHRNKPSFSDDNELEISAQNSVFTPRPTVRLR